MSANKIFIFIFILGIGSKGLSQDSTTTKTREPQLVVKGISKDFKVFLRWAVNDKFAWKKGNTYGYTIERLTIRRDGKLLDNAVQKIITKNPLKPKPLAEWKSIVTTNDMAAIAAQAIYGKDFNTDSENKNAVISVINQSDELERRFGFALLALDQDFEAARFSGLGYIDEDVLPNEEYLYNIKMAIPDSILKINQSGVIVKPIKERKLPVPYDFAGYYYNNSFVLIWEYENLSKFYTSYHLERSEDGLNFSRVNKVPITKLTDQRISGISYTDSIPQYEKKYWYRVKGKTFFNEISPSSDTVSVIAYKKLLATPTIKKLTMVSDKEVNFNWDFDTSEAWKLRKFEVLRADTPPGPFEIVGENLESDQRTFRYNQLQPINYFKVRAYGIGGDYQDSSPHMVQPIDSISPIAPKGLIGSIDTLGIVQLNWNKNLELDLKGYTVFRANRPNQEYTKLNKQELTKTSFTDTINLKGFNEKVYYQLAALDNRYNESKRSETLVLERPLTIPPMSPVIANYEVLEDKVVLAWINSSSEKLASHIIYRKKADASQETLWEKVYETSDLQKNTFEDGSIAKNTKYLYTVVALGTNGIESDPAPPISVITYKNLLQNGVKGLYANVDRENKFIQLSWQKQNKNVVELQLYRKVGKENKLKLYQVLPKEQKRFLDTKVQINTTYTYGIKAIFADGTISKWQEIEVVF